MDKPAASRWHPYPAEKPDFPPPPRMEDEPSQTYLVRRTWGVYAVDWWMGEAWFCAKDVEWWAEIHKPEE